MAWTTPRTWTDGELVTKAIMDPHIRDNMNALTRFVGKTADESVVSSTAVQDDNHLFFAMGANEQWFFSGNLWHENATASVHFKFTFTVPASADYHVFVLGTATGGAFNASNIRSSADEIAEFTGSTGNLTTFAGVVFTGGTSGNLQLRWAQNSSNASATVLKKGSAMWFQRVQ